MEYSLYGFALFFLIILGIVAAKTGGSSVIKAIIRVTFWGTVIVTFNTVGEIVTMETQRFMKDTKRENWVCRMANYKEINDIKIPFSAEAMWKLQTGDYSYAKFEVQKIEYNNNHS